MFIDEVDQDTLKEFGQLVLNMKTAHRALRNFLFVIDENGESVEEQFEGSSELFEVFKMFIEGNELSYIGESVFQDDEEPIKKILGIVGIIDDDIK